MKYLIIYELVPDDIQIYILDLNDGVDDDIASIIEACHGKIMGATDNDEEDELNLLSLSDYLDKQDRIEINSEEILTITDAKLIVTGAFL